LIHILEVTLQESSVLCGFGRAKFKEAPVDPSQIDPDVEIPFDVGADTHGVLDNVYGTMAEHLHLASQTKPENCRVCYHKASKDPEGNWVLEKAGATNC